MSNKLDPTELIAKGPTTSMEEVRTKISNAEPANINLDQLDREDKEIEKASSLEGESDIPFDLNDFKKGEEKKEIKKEPVEEKKKVEVKQEVEEKEEDVPFTSKGVRKLPKEPLEDQLKDEDFKDLPEEAKPIFKKMDKVARAWVKEQLDSRKKLESENKELLESKDRLPANYFEHEDGYILDKNWKASYQAASESKNLGNYWKEQYTKVRLGEKWNNLVLDAAGNVVAQEQEPGAQAEVYLTERMQQENSNFQKHQDTLNNIKTNYKVLAAQALNSVRQYEDLFFPQYKDGKKLEGDVKFKKIGEFLNKNGLKSNPLAGMVSKLYAYSMEQNEYIQELEGTKENKEVIKNQRKKAGPSSGDLTGEQVKEEADPMNKPFSMDEFNKIKNPSYA